MSHKLSLLRDQIIPANGWNSSEFNPYNQEAINEITDNIGPIEVPVTSIPSPFAQLHLFETAFSFINKTFSPERPEETLIGETTYHRYISQCLDIFEILFSYETLSLQERLTVEVWEKKELDELIRDPNYGRKTFAETLSIFITNYNQDPNFAIAGVPGAYDQFILIYLDNMIIAGSSPSTGFCTIGDELPTSLLGSFNSRPFFSNYLPLYDRSIAFQKFMNALFTKHSELANCFEEVHTYIINNRACVQSPEMRAWFADLENNLGETELSSYNPLVIGNTTMSLLSGTVPFVCPERSVINELAQARNSHFAIRTSKSLENSPLALTETMNKDHWNYLDGPFPDETELNTTYPISSRTLPTSTTVYPWITRDDFLSPHLAQLSYDVNRSKFWLPEGEVQNIILPIKPAYFEYFTINDLKEQLHIKKLKQGGIVVKLNIPVRGENRRGVIKFERTYNAVPVETIDNPNNGALIESSLVFGVYPFFKVSDKRYNDRYKVLAYHRTFEEMRCLFLRENLSDARNTTIPNAIHSRTRKEEGLGYITNYIDLTTISGNIDDGIQKDDSLDITFDIVAITIDNNAANCTLGGILIPEMNEVINLTSEASSISFDIGTSNSYVAVKTGGNIESLATFSENQRDGLSDLVMLHKPKSDAAVTDYDLEPIDTLYGIAQRAEFLPSQIGNRSNHKFPIRSIINVDNDTMNEELSALNTLSDANIPFGFGQQQLRPNFDITYSNIKWGVAKDNKPAIRRLFAFIEQLAWMGRNHLLRAGKNPSFSQVIWFKPLSMGEEQRILFNLIWKAIHQNYFGRKENIENLTNITESWAPVKSYDNYLGTGRTYMNIDIGGGTTDIILFDDEKPVSTTSFRFAGNGLFESLSNSNHFDNGFVTKYEKEMRKNFKGDVLKEKILEYIKESNGLSSTDLISYFFQHNVFSTSLTLDSEFKLLFLLHNSAILYHAAQFLKLSKVEEVPKYIGVSGNGARLLEITNGGKDLNRNRGMAHLATHIFKKVFQNNTLNPLTLQVLDSPKESTAKGGILGLSHFKNHKNADWEAYTIALGDGQNSYKVNAEGEKNKPRYAQYLKTEDNTIDDVAQNVTDFFDYFFTELWNELNLTSNFGLDKGFNSEKLRQYFSNKETIQDIIRKEINTKLFHEQELNETLFFYPIKAYLYDFSKVLVSGAINDYKGAK